MVYYNYILQIISAATIFGHKIPVPIMFAPIGINKLDDIRSLRDDLAKHGAELRLHIDHVEQVAALEGLEESRPSQKRWSVFMKVDCGNLYVSSFTPAARTFQFNY